MSLSPNGPYDGLTQLCVQLKKMYTNVLNSSNLKIVFTTFDKSNI